MRRGRSEEAEWLPWGHREACIAVLYAPELFPKTPRLPDLGPSCGSGTLQTLASLLTFSRSWWLRPTLVPLAVNYVLRLLLPVTVQVLTLRTDLGPFRFPWAWILVTSPSLPGLPVDLFQGKGKAGRGCWQAAGISGAPQPKCPATLDLQASDHIPVKWQKPQHLPHRLLSQWDEISHARAKCAMVWIHRAPSLSSFRGPRLVGYKTGGLRFRRCACQPRQCPLFLWVHEESPPHWASVSPIRK